MNTYPPLYKRDSKGKIRVWFMEVDGEKYRTTSGLDDGKKVTTEWTVAKGKNQGRANETTPEQQAVAEIEAQYRKKQDLAFFDKIEDVDNTRYFEPMLAPQKKWNPDKFVQEDFDNGVFVQPKLDGMRCIAKVDGLWSRRGKPIVSVPHIWDTLAPVFELYPDLMLDGELYNHELHDDFNKIMSLVKKLKPSQEDLNISESLVQYHLYDMPVDVIQNQISFSGRSESLSILVDSIDDPSGYLQLVDTFQVSNMDELDEYNGKWLEQFYEGQMVRRDDPYKSGRTNSLIKRKVFFDDEFEIIRIEEGEGNWSGCAKTVVCKTKTEIEFGATLKGTQEYTRKVMEIKDSFVGKEVTVRYPSYTPDGKPRFAIAVALHDTPRW